MVAFFKKPMLHFWLLGLMYYVFVSGPATESLSVNYPDAQTVSELRSQWVKNTGRAPSEPQLEQMIQLKIDQQMLLQEAVRLDLHLVDTVVQQRLLRDMRFMGESGDEADLLQQAYNMGLHLNDEVARRRLVQAMESILRAEGESISPQQQDLQRIYDERLGDFTLPAVQSFSHVFISRDKHDGQAQQRAENLFKAFAADSVSIDTAQKSSDPFLSGLAFNNLSQQQTARHFGDSFAAASFQCKSRELCGPIESAYGWHLLWIQHREKALPQPLASVSDKLEYMYRREQGDKTLAEQMQILREKYTVQKS